MTIRNAVILIVPYLLSSISRCIQNTQRGYCCDALRIHGIISHQQSASSRRTKAIPSLFAASASKRRIRWSTTTSLEVKDDDNDVPSSPSSPQTRLAKETDDDKGKPSSTSSPTDFMIPSVSLSTVTDWLTARMNRADEVEIRLDTTLAACYVLARFLIHDVATGPKAVPGWELEDWIHIVSTLSSAVVLAACWTVSGLLVTQSFELRDRDGDYDEDPINATVLTLVNVMVATPVWLTAERILLLGPPGLQQYEPSDVYLTTGLGLASFMVLAKSATSGWR